MRCRTSSSPPPSPPPSQSNAPSWMQWADEREKRENGESMQTDSGWENGSRASTQLGCQDKKNPFAPWTRKDWPPSQKDPRDHPRFARCGYIICIKSRFWAVPSRTKKSVCIHAKPQESPFHSFFFDLDVFPHPWDRYFPFRTKRNDSDAIANFFPPLSSGGEFFFLL